MSKGDTLSNPSLASTFASILVISFIVAAKSLAAEPALTPAWQSNPLPIGGILRDSALWTAYRARFVDKSGRIIDTGNGKASHSEGQGYGMLLAAAAADRSSFDAIWSWTKENLMVRPDRLAAWKWDPDTKRADDKNNATDGDILIAWALAEAAELWDSPNYLSAARGVTDDIIEKAIRIAPGQGHILMPAARGFSRYESPDGPVVNLSYWVFPAFPRLAQINPRFDGRALTIDGLELLRRGRFGALELPPDWLSLESEADGAKPVPAQNFPRRFGYDSIRIPLYLFWAGILGEGALRAFEGVWTSEDSKGQLIDLGAVGKNLPLDEPGYLAIGALVRCTTMKQTYPAEFYRFRSNQNYYPATIHMLSLLAAAARGGPCLDQAAVSDNMPHIGKSHTSSMSSSVSQITPRAGLAPQRERTAPHLAASGINATESAKRKITVKNDERDDAVLMFYLRWALGGLVATTALFSMVRRINLKSLSPKPEARESLFLNAASIIPRRNDDALMEAPRTLPYNPFTHSSDTAILGRQIEIAAEACVRFSRTIGVIYFEVGSLKKLDRQLGAQVVDLKVAALVAELGRLLRATDYIATPERNQIVICICLLENTTDLKSIAARLWETVQRHGIVPQPAGYSVYPLNGYSGEELINAAREDYLSKGGSKRSRDSDSIPKQFTSNKYKTARHRSADKTAKKSACVAAPASNAKMSVIAGKGQRTLGFKRSDDLVCEEQNLKPLR